MCSACLALGQDIHFGLEQDDLGPLALNAEDRGGTGPNGKLSLTPEGAAAAIGRYGVTWGPGAVVTFAFRSSAPSTMPDDTSGFSIFTAQQISQTLLALQSWSDVADITFSRVGGTGYSNNATILFGNYSSGSDGAAAFAYLPGDASAGAVHGDVWVNSSIWYNASPAYLNYGRHVLTHEIGHAIGLRHPGNYNAGTGSPTYADADYYEDTRQFTVMSYWSETNTGADFQGYYAAAPLLDDIAALQLIYGVNNSTRTGDTVYGFNSNTDRDYYTATGANSALIFAVWDAGGYDTLDFSGYTQNQVIDLRQGHFSNVGGLIGNVAIAQGAVIERAIGGSGNDTMYAQAYVTPVAVADIVKTQGQINNGFGNAISVNGGFDLTFNNAIVSSTSVPHATVQAVAHGGLEHFSFTGGAGETVTIDIDGTSGIDTVVRLYSSAGVLLASNDDGPLDVGSSVRQDSFLSFTLPAAGTYYIVVGAYAGSGSGGHVAYNALPAGSVFTMHVSLTGVSTPGGAVIGSTLEGGAGNDTLYGDIGDDTLIGGAGNDTYYVNNRGDVVVEVAGGGYDIVHSSVSFDARFTHVEEIRLLGSAAANIVGNDLDNRMIGNDANNIFKGHGGDDYMEGRGGDDTYYVDSRGDVVVEVAGGGYDIVHSSVSFDARFTHVEEIRLLGSAAANIVGNDLDNRMIGNNANNIFKGQGGDDYMEGRGGDDTYYVDSRGDVVVEVAGGGYDIVHSSVSFDARFTHVEEIRLLGSAAANAVGNDLDNRMIGNNANNIFKGYDGDDYMEGRGGDDTLIGGPGNDTLIGGAGIDTLTGGSGADTFLFRPDELGGDPLLAIITDFDASEDILDLRQIDANPNVAGNQSFTWAPGGFTGQAGQAYLSYDAGANRTTLALDLDGDGVADYEIHLAGEVEQGDHFLI